MQLLIDNPGQKSTKSYVTIPWSTDKRSITRQIANLLCKLLIKTLPSSSQSVGMKLDWTESITLDKAANSFTEFAMTDRQWFCMLTGFIPFQLFHFVCDRRIARTAKNSYDQTPWKGITTEHGDKFDWAFESNIKKSTGKSVLFGKKSPVQNWSCWKTRSGFKTSIKHMKLIKLEFTWIFSNYDFNL